MTTKQVQNLIMDRNINKVFRYKNGIVDTDKERITDNILNMCMHATTIYKTMLSQNISNIEYIIDRIKYG